MANRTVTVNVGGKMHTLARYNVEVDDPRPGQYIFPLIKLCSSEKAKVIKLQLQNHTARTTEMLKNLKRFQNKRSFIKI